MPDSLPIPVAMIVLLALVFVFSGAAGLIYESIWSRYLALFVGHSAYAQVIVLVIFLGGMSAGALVVGRRSARLREPLLAYALVEAIVGCFGLLFHSTYVAVTGAAYDRLFPALTGTPWVALSRWAIAGLLILPQSVLLGATFPLMSAGLIRRVRVAPGRMLALLYFTNSLGAAVGVLVSGFYLVAAAGLPGTVAAAAILNLAVAATVIVALRLERLWNPAARAMGGDARVAMPPALALASRPGLVLSRLERLLLLVSFFTAVSSFIYEIAWTRMLALVLGSATHAFELMLSAFILGLALGALWVRSRIDTLRHPTRVLGVVQWTMGLLAIATLPVYIASFDWTASLLAAFTRTVPGYQLFTLSRYAICLAVMLPATVCAGMTLPLLTRMLFVQGAGERAIGTVYGVNTLGSIAGAALAALVLLPWLGLERLIIAGAAIDMALGVVLLAREEPGRKVPRWLVPAAAAAAGLLVFGVPQWFPLDRTMLTSGVYRTGRVMSPRECETLFYHDGRTATVSVRRSQAVVTLSTNGKPDASLNLRWLGPDTHGGHLALDNDDSTQLLLALITLAHAPDARHGAVIGLGSGVSSHYILGSPRLEDLATIEIEPEIMRAARAFYPANRRVFDDARSRIVLDDAKSYFAASPRPFDLILSEPSNPWVSGVSGLFTTEFYRRVGTHLSADGVFGQWLHLYEIDDRLVLSVIAAIHENFHSYEAFLVSGCDMLIVATNRRSGLHPDWSVVRYPAIARDLSLVTPLTPANFEAMRLANRATLAPLIDAGVSPNSDYFPTLDLGAERARYLRLMADGFVRLNSDRFGLAPFVMQRHAAVADQPEVATPSIPRVRARAIAAQLHESAQGGMARAVVPDLDGGAARYRRRVLEGVLAGSGAPPDWREWVHTVLDVEQDMDGGSAGAVDEAFYTSLEHFMSKHHAPAEAFAAVRFVHALAIWDFERGARAADPLIAASLRGEPWLRADVLCDGAVSAKLMAGDAPGARRALEALAPLLHRDPQDVRTRMLVSYVDAMEQKAAAQAVIAPASGH